MQSDNLEMNVIKRKYGDDFMSFAVQTNYKNKVYVVSFKKYSAPMMMEWGSTYEYTTSVFEGTASGDVENFSVFISSYDNSPTEEMAVRYVKKLVMEFIESDNE